MPNQLTGLEPALLSIKIMFYHLEIEEDSEKEKVFLKMESTIDSIIKKYNS